MSNITPPALPLGADVQTQMPAAPAPAAEVSSEEALRAEYVRLTAERDQLAAQLARVGSEQIEPGDSRLERVWALARRYAEASDEISNYNTLARELDGPVATSEYEVEVRVTYSGVVVVTVDAESRDDAEEMVGDFPTSRISEGVDLDDLMLDDWEVIG